MNSSGHPLITDTAQIITHQMVRVLGLCLDRIAVRRSAVLFEGEPRVGKSRCSEFIAEQLKARLPNTLVMLHVARYREPRRRESVLSELCSTEKIKPVPRGVDYLEHLLAYIESRLAEVAGSQCILIVDEIQHWRANDFQLLADLHNYLQAKSIHPTLIGFAQSEIYGKVEGFRAVNSYQIIARFFPEIIPFQGCRNSDDLASILRACDEGSEFPSGSGVSYTAYFVPKAFAIGFRLCSLTDIFWISLCESAKGKYAKNIPMQHVRESIIDLLLMVAPHDSALLEVDSKLVSEAVRRTGLHDFCDVL